MSFCHLHVHMEYSALDGLGKATDYAARAKELGFGFIGCTDHGNVDGLIKFQKACEEAEIKPVMGCEFYIVPDAKVKEKGEKRNHVVVLIKNKIGWSKVLKMLTYAHLEGFYYRPRIDHQMLLDNCEGLVVLTACISSFIYNEGGEGLLLQLAERLPGDVYLEVMPHNDPRGLQAVHNERMRELNKKHKLPMVATHDCHYVLAEDEHTQEVLLCVQNKKKLDDPKRFKFEFTGLCLRTVDEMKEGFRQQRVLSVREVNRAMANTVEIAEKCCDFRIEKLDVHLPKVPGYEDRDEEDLLWQLCSEGWVDKIENTLADYLNDHGMEAEEVKREEYEERLWEEYSTITDLGFARYFLLVWELIDWCKRNDIMCGPGRGSVGGCLIAYLLGITAVDPVEFGLLFSRFISPARIDLPDIDMDFEDTKRWKIRQHLEEMYGEYNVAGVTTFMKMKGRGALRDVGRVCDLPLAEIDAAAKSIVVRSGGDFRSDFSIEDAFATFEDGRAFQAKYPEATAHAMRLEGQVRGVGQHAAAMVVSKDDLRKGERAYLKLGKKDKEIVVNWDKEDAEYMGLMKLDVLGLNALTVLNETRKLVKDNHGVEINYEDLPLDDPEVFKEFTAGNNVGCFQFGTLGLQKYCQEVGIEGFEDLVVVNALYRPGTLRSGMTAEYTRRKQGQSKWDYIETKDARAREFMEELTGDTYGIIVYQEQVMRFMYDLGGLGWRTADTVRKVISKSKGVEQFQMFKEMFIEGCKERQTLDEETSGKVWDQLASFGSYGFNRSHSVEYSLIAYWDMYMKIYHPAEFICCSLTYGSEGKKEDYVEEAKRLGLTIVPPKAGKSRPNEWVTEGDKLYIPFIDVKGIGEKTASKLANLGEDGVSKDFFTKDSGPRISANIMKALDEVGVFADKEDYSEDELESFQHRFSFSLSRDPMRHVRGVYGLLAEYINFDKINNLDFQKPSKKLLPYFGQMTEIKFGYRGKIDTVEKQMGLSGMAGSLGGVYGNFKDDTDFCMLVFDGKIYNDKKFMVEHCAEQWLVALANHPNPTTSILCSDAWFQEEILSGKLEGLGLKLAQERRFRANRQLLKCTACELHQRCTAPVLPSPGKFNIVLAGESPGRNEDEQGEGFVGKAGIDVLWPELAKYGLFREMFYVTNINKCWPDKKKGEDVPNKKHVKICSELWFGKELEQVKPFLILAMGKNCVRYFRGEDSGIMKLSGMVEGEVKEAVTEWNDDVGAWICWSIHPASVLYNPANVPLFEEGIRNFADKVNVLGGIKVSSERGKTEYNNNSRKESTHGRPGLQRRPEGGSVRSPQRVAETATSAHEVGRSPRTSRI